MNRLRVGLALGFLSVFAVALASCEWLMPEQPGPEDQTVVGVFSTGGTPHVELADGRTFPLDSTADWQEDEDRFSPLAVAFRPLSLVSPMDVPGTVDLRNFQTPIKEQWGGTCVQFATTAALEALYARIAGNVLDLSERFGQLLQKMSHLTEDLQPLAYCRENQLGAWDGGGLYYQLQLFTRYRLPPESDLPYPIAVDPNLDWEASRCAAGTDQVAMDDWNLDPVNLPQTALRNARYGARAVEFCPPELVTDPTWYEAVLANGYEIIFSAVLCGEDPSPGNGVWDPGTAGECGGHAMLMVGYRHADRVFIVKNSWGFNAEQGEAGFTLMSYNWVEDGWVVDAGYITSVATDTADPSQDHMLLGRWNVDHDGWKGTLDIYRFSGLFTRDSIHGENDLRLGTYWGSDGIARRVNGTIDGHEIDFRIDWNFPNLDYGDIQGMHFMGYLFTRDPVMLAGTMIDNRDHQWYPFYATKDQFLVGVPAGGLLGPESYLGRWEMNHDGWTGLLVLDDLRPSKGTSPTTAIWGTYTPTGGTAVPVSAEINNSDPREVIFQIGLVDGTQGFLGHLLSHEQGIMAGTTESHGTTYGFVARRLGSPE